MSVGGTSSFVGMNDVLDLRELLCLTRLPQIHVANVKSNSQSIMHSICSEEAGVRTIIPRRRINLYHKKYKGYNHR